MCFSLPATAFLVDTGAQRTLILCPGSARSAARPDWSSMNTLTLRSGLFLSLYKTGINDTCPKRNPYHSTSTSEGIPPYSI